MLPDSDIDENTIEQQSDQDEEGLVDDKHFMPTQAEEPLLKMND